jgi:DNA-binding PadR family transcriptional regulator
VTLGNCAGPVNRFGPTYRGRAVLSDNPAVALKTSSYVILGLVRGGITSGYALKRFIRRQRMDLFWSTTMAQIYPELAQLEQAGYLSYREDPHGARKRRAYAVTAAGERALMSWIRRARIPPRELRDEGLLRLAFANDLPREEAIELVSRLRARAEEGERELREEVIPRFEALGSPPGVNFPIEVALLGAGHDAVTAAHLRRLEEQLRGEART